MKSRTLIPGLLAFAAALAACGGQTDLPPDHAGLEPVGRESQAVATFVDTGWQVVGLFNDPPALDIDLGANSDYICALSGVMGFLSSHYSAVKVFVESDQHWHLSGVAQPGDGFQMQAHCQSRASLGRTITLESDNLSASSATVYSSYLDDVNSTVTTADFEFLQGATGDIGSSSVWEAWANSPVNVGGSWYYQSQLNMSGGVTAYGTAISVQINGHPCEHTSGCVAMSQVNSDFTGFMNSATGGPVSKGVGWGGTSGNANNFCAAQGWQGPFNNIAAGWSIDYTYSPNAVATVTVQNGAGMPTPWISVACWTEQ